MYYCISGIRVDNNGKTSQKLSLIIGDLEAMYFYQSGSFGIGLNTKLDKCDKPRSGGGGGGGGMENNKFQFVRARNFKGQWN